MVRWPVRWRTSSARCRSRGSAAIGWSAVTACRTRPWRLAGRSSEGRRRRLGAGLRRAPSSSICPCGGFRPRGGWSPGSRWPSWSPAWRRWPRWCCCRSSSGSRRWRGRHWSTARAAGQPCGHPRRRRLRVGAWRQEPAGQRRADRAGRDPPHSRVGHDAGGLFRRRDRGRARARTGASRASRHLAGHRARVGVDPAGACGHRRGAARRGPCLGVSSPADLAGMPLLVLAAGAVSLVLTPAALALSRRHERRADRFALAADGEPVGVHLGDAPARRAEPCRRAALTPGAVAVPQPPAARRAPGLRPRVAQTTYVNHRATEDTEDAQRSFVGFPNPKKLRAFS